MNKELRFLAALALIPFLAGCYSRQTSNIDVVDRSTFIPTVRVTADLSDRPGPRSQAHTSHALELGLTGARGDDTLRLAPAQQPLVFGGQTFAAPQDVRAEFDFRFVELAYRYRHVFDRTGFGVEGLAGVGYAQLGLTLTGTTQRAAERLSNTGFVLGLGGIWRFRPTTSLQLRGTGFASGSDDDVSSATRFDLQLVQALGQHAAVRAGYATWSVRSDRETQDFSTSIDSPIRVRFSGPTLGLELMF